MDAAEKITGLEMMRKPFLENQISQMCRSTKKENPKGKCPKCGGWHGLPAIQLTYVGHAALTDRLLDADPAWTWEPLAVDAAGYPVIDRDGGMWIKLTVCGVTRLGYGDAQGKSGGDAMKERIGDALRNAAMRFGAALDLWHKGILHLDEEEAPEPKQKTKVEHAPEGPVTDAAVIATHISALEACKTLETLKDTFGKAWRETHGAPAVKGAYDKYKKIMEMETQQ